ncbi:MAG TPA: hypothetical protein ENH05_03080 [Rhizobiales bacterium]|nr:hypothetical protein BMS3Bbin10_01306 [bacterium BMS3Bbin10]HDO51701.1 hypothetical protein [Hyphomicrobiales bacterium]
MDAFSITVFAAVGLGAGHIAHKTSEGGINLWVALTLGLAGALTGGLGAAAVGMKFYELLGQMVVSAGCATLFLLIWRQMRA